MIAGKAKMPDPIMPFTGNKAVPQNPTVRGNVLVSVISLNARFPSARRLGCAKPCIAPQYILNWLWLLLKSFVKSTPNQRITNCIDTFAGAHRGSSDEAGCF
jgi:hypothetical protein